MVPVYRSVLINALLGEGENALGSKTSKYVPPECQEDLVLAWIRRARESQMAHYEMANSLSYKGRFLGVPVIVITSLIGTSVFASLASEIIPAWSKIVVGFLSLAAVVLSSLQTFFNYSDRAEKHRSSGANFGAVRRKLEIIYAKREHGINLDEVEVLRAELDGLAQDSLHVPAHVFRVVQKNVLYVGGGRNNPLQPIASVNAE